MNVREKILEKLFEDPSKRYYVRELARETKTSPSSVARSINELEKEHLIKKEVKRHTVEVAANISEQKFISKKRVFNLSRIYEARIIEELAKTYNPKAIVMFGSYSRGEDIKKSDIDIAIITGKKELANVEEFEKKLKRRIHLLLVEYKEISEELYVNLINGIVLYGYLDKR